MRALLLAAALVAGPALALPAPSANHRDIWSFSSGPDGASPRGELLIDSAGNMYGTASTGGASGDGVVFLATPPPGGTGEGTVTPLYSFTGGADGSLPMAGLVMDPSGALYGTTAMDGAGQAGTAFQLTPPAQGGAAWTENTIWSFGTDKAGRTPTGALTRDTAGALYGTAQWGGRYGFGTVFRLLPPGGGSSAWSATVLWDFTGGADGANPVAGLVFDSAGRLYGTAKAGGSGGVGTVFQLTPKAYGVWVEATLKSFNGGVDGGTPTGTLAPDGAGGFYGTTEYGGPLNPACNQARYPYYGEPDAESELAARAAYVPVGGNRCGVVFHLTPPAQGGANWTVSPIWQFDGGLDGANPVAGVLVGRHGELYCLATQYGQQFWGTEILLTPPAGGGAWTELLLASFDGKSQGFYPRGTLAFGADGLVYGTTAVGGKYWTHVSSYGYGSIFRSVP